MSEHANDVEGRPKPQPEHPTPWWSAIKADGTAYILDARNVTVIRSLTSPRTAEAIVHAVNATDSTRNDRSTHQQVGRTVATSTSLRDEITEELKEEMRGWDNPVDTYGRDLLATAATRVISKTLDAQRAEIERLTRDLAKMQEVAAGAYTIPTATEHRVEELPHQEENHRGQ